MDLSGLAPDGRGPMDHQPPASAGLRERWRVSRLSLAILWQMVAQAGPRRAWGFAWAAARQALRGQGLPHTPEVNAALWTHYDWSRRGEEWSDGPEWTASVVEHLLIPHVPPGSRVLEIGAGAGRWTQHLAPRASRLVVVDVTPRCIELCRARFRACSHLEYVVNDGSDLGFLPPASIDRVWSWDVFIHVGIEDIRRYLVQLGRILVPGGAALIQHAAAPYARGWRTAVPAERMAAFGREAGLDTARQFATWGGGRYRTPTPADLVTVLAKPAA